MRIVIDIMIGLMVVGVVAVGAYLYTNREQDKRDVEVVQQALQQLNKQATYHRTMQSAMADRDVMLVHVHQQWFGEDVPTNALLDADRPWIDLAPPGDLGEHPPDPVVYSSEQAAFWYNPTNAVFRARVRPAASEALTLALYNEVNGSALPGFEQIPDPNRQPLAHTPGTTPAHQYAAMANKTWSEAQDEEQLETGLIEAQAAERQQAQASASAEQVNLSADAETKRNNLQNVQKPGEEADNDESQTPKRPTLK